MIPVLHHLLSGILFLCSWCKRPFTVRLIRDCLIMELIEALSIPCK